MIDQEKIKAAVTMLLEAIGEDPDREGLKETPRRFAEMFAEVFSGIDQDPKAELKVGFEESHREMVIVCYAPNA